MKRTDSSILMIIVGDGIMCDLHFCPHMLLFPPFCFCKQYVLLFFYVNLFIYLFFGCIGSLLLCVGFL